MNVPIETILPYAGLAVTLIASLILFVSLKTEIRRDRARYMKALDDGKADHSALAREVLKIKREVLSIPGLTHPKAADGEPPLPRRSQIVRMYQTGIEPNQIAAVLCTPIREVELAIRANRLREGAGAIVK